uniref:Laminin G domain-containing protein n=1 Tax=Pygocentrus nattereri TaxID=42514 RepID=A0AAR2LLA9_PYGNA
THTHIKPLLPQGRGAKIVLNYVLRILHSISCFTEPVLYTVYVLNSIRGLRTQLQETIYYPSVLDLGSGERILNSDRGNPLNDLAWHTIDLVHDRNNVSLTVDKHFQTSQRLPGPQQELNVKDGLYVGGTGGLDKVYLPSDLTGFRGCLDEVLFNEHNLLSSLRSYSGLKNVYEVSLGCSPQFFAIEEDSISFFSSRAYISLPPWSAQQEWTLECSVHTSAQEGIIMYNSARQGDFVTMEIHEGLLVAMVGRDGMKTELRSLTFVNDKKWHTVKLYFTSKSLQLSVDGETVKSSISSRSKALQLKGFLFLGGVDDSTRSEVRKVGLSSVAGKRIKGGSFKGCFRDIKVNGVPTGLPHAVVTKDISVGCELEKEPDITTTLNPATIPQTFAGSVTPLPPIDVSTLAKGLVKKYGQNFLQLRNLVVPEGGRASLDSKHIKVNLDFKKLGIRQSQIMFRIEEQPVHGQLRFDVDQEQEENTFSMLDLWHGRVMYIHGGSEDPRDYFMFSIFSNSRKETPIYLKGHKLYRFNVTVTPTNDAPELSLPEGNLFILLENSRKKLTTDVLKATDVDSNVTDLVYSVLGNLNADAGFLETEDNPGQAITSFPHSALEDGKINYVHTGVRNSRIVLRVSDGEKVSNTVVLRIMAFGLEYSIMNNTGLEVTQGETSLISTTQLAVRTNAVKQMVDIRYDVTEPPRFGELQRLHSSGEWKFTNSFSQRVLEKDRLRYLSTFKSVQSGNVTDHFKCKVTIASKATEQLVFNIKMKWVNFTVERNEIIEMDKIRRAAIDSQHLYATAQGVTVTEAELNFRLLSSTKKGMILLNDEKLEKNSTFSQMDVTDMKVEYQLVDRTFEDTVDSFEFQVFTKHAHSASHVFKINIKADINSIYIRNNGLSVFEGESKLITKDDLFAETLSTKEMYYTVTKSPKHGKLARINLSNSTESYDRLISFTYHDILEERLMYVHDDSETTHDQFTFIASSSPVAKTSVNEDEVGSKEGVFNISILLVNDEKPIRIVDEVFHVVRDGQRLLTLDDLCYHDADSDFSDGQLVYTRRGIPMGDLVLVNDTSHKLYQFTQEDLAQKRVLFIHRGVSSGRFVLFVSDGKHYVSSLLDISAQDPYLRVDNNTGLLVQKGQAKTFSSANFSVVTNLDVREESEITFKIHDAPKHGGLFLKDKKIESFTQHELKNALLSYHHDNSKNLADFFSVMVKAKGLRLDARINVKVYLESHQRPPVILHSKTLRVEEGKPVKIERSKLEVTHEANLPSEIIFTVKVAPTYGYLRGVVDDQYQGSEEKPMMNFTQEDINAGNIQYVQMVPDQVNDSFILEASNGVADVSDITLTVDVIPRLIPVEVSNITLKEGASKALTEKTIRVSNQHFSGLHFVYYVSEGPLHGHIENSRFPGLPTTYFTRKQSYIMQMYGDYLKLALSDLRICVGDVPGAVVTEGDKVVIDRMMLDASNLLTKEAEPRRHSYDVWYQVKTLPQHGIIVVGERNLTKEKPYFSQFILNKYGITYQHDDSETTHDHFIFDAFLNLKSKPAQRPFDDSEVIEEAFNITVTPVNDQPPILKTKAPSLKVVQGDTIALGPSNLNVSDLDNPPDEILYSVISRPTNGYLAFAGSLNMSADAFSQAQINSGEVFFVQDGSPVSGVFYFSVTDGHHRPVYKLFNLEVIQISVSLINHTEIVLEQGKTSVDLTSSHLAAVTNGKNTNIHYKITVPPRYGKLLLFDNDEVFAFDQEDLQAHRLSYHMINPVSSHDSFEFTVFTSDTNLTDQVVNITVKPLIQYAKSVGIPNGQRVKLKAGYLNASELALISGSDPMFEILSSPMYGKVLRIETNKVKKVEPVRTFSFSELQQGKLAIEVTANLTGVQEVNDSFRFVIKADSHQPAIGEFTFTIVPFDRALMTTTVVPAYTTSPVSPSQTTVMNTALLSTSPLLQSTQLLTKAVTKFKGRNRWGNSNRSDSHGTTIAKPGHGQEITPMKNTPLRVESAPQSSSSNPMLIILPLLAIVLLIIVVVLVLILRRNRQKKQKPLKSASASSSCPDGGYYQGHPERSTTFPLVTVTPLSPKKFKGSPAQKRLHTSSGNSAYGQSMALCSFEDQELEPSQFCRTTNPTLQHNQYWV